MKNLTKNSTNQELISVFGKEKINSGKTIIFAIEATKNENLQHLFVFQSIKTESNANNIQKMLLGWSDERIIRGHHNVLNEIADSFNIGDELPFDILIEEKFEPQYEGQQPKVYPNTHILAGKLYTINDRNVYEHSSLVDLGKGGIVKLERPAVTFSESISADIKIKETLTDKKESVTV